MRRGMPELVRGMKAVIRVVVRHLLKLQGVGKEQENIQV